MADEKVAASAQTLGRDPWSWCMDHGSPAVKASFGLYAGLYEEGMASASRFCEDQATHLRNLSECRSPWDLAAYQIEFLEKLVAFGLDENRRIADRMTKAFRAG